ncbi:MAG: hypothetical protein Q4D60_02350 [Eubacteriales bacterium]|nr:hypothetical protein [Eubacteriales bacterium]
MPAFIIWTLTAAIFVCIGISTRKSETENGFFTFVPPKKMKDVKAYNHAVARLWLVFAALLEMLGLPVLFLEQNSGVFVFTILGVVVLVLCLMISYLKIEQKYRV